MFKKKKILALIPARGGSKGIKNKNLRRINGKPLIYYTINFINKLRFVDLKIVSSDKNEILNYAQKKYKIESTPTIFINEKKYNGKVEYSEFKKVLEKNL